MYAAGARVSDLSGGGVVRDTRRDGGSAKALRQKKREIHYALACREGAVFLVQRARDARLMAGMWELPEMDGSTSGAEARSNGVGEIAAVKTRRHPKAGARREWREIA